MSHVSLFIHVRTRQSERRDVKSNVQRRLEKKKKEKIGENSENITGWWSIYCCCSVLPLTAAC